MADASRFLYTKNFASPAFSFGKQIKAKNIVGIKKNFFPPNG